MKCWICGDTATRTKLKYDGFQFYEPEPSRHYRCYCDKCLKSVKETEREERELYIKLKKRQMFLRAVELLENQHTDMYEYKEAIETVEEFLGSNPDKFDSAYEVLTAIILVHNRIHSKMQYKVGKYQVDFLLPDLMVILEIDGDRHKHRKDYDSARDKEIKKELGPHWNIIRIPTEHLDRNAKKIPKAIDEVLEHRATGHINWRSL